MKTRAIATALLIAFSPLAVPALQSPAFAQDDPLTVQARARFKEGVEYYDKGQYENARASFLQAYALKSHPAVLLNLAQSCLRANHSLEAIKYFQQYLQKAQNPTPQQRHDAEAGLEEARSKVGHVDIVAPAGTEVSIVGGDRIGNAPFGEGLDLDPGPYTFKSRATDGSSENVKVTVVAGQRAQVKFGGATAAVPPVVPAVVPPVTPPDSGTGAPPPDTGQTPPPDTGVSKPVNNQPGILSPPKTLVPVFVGGGVAVAGFVVAIIFAASKGGAQSSADSVDGTIRSTATGRGLNPKGICSSTAATAKDFQPACATYKSDLDAVNADATVANVMGTVGVLGLLFAGGWYLFAPKRDAVESPNGPSNGSPPPTTSFTIEPVVGVHMNGFSLSGTF